MASLVKLFLLLFLASPTFSFSSDPIVEISNGKIRGRDHGHYLSFESIPYAEPPVGENRFEDPKPFEQNWSDIRDATKSPPKCMQWDQHRLKMDLPDGQEDCLTINVYTPSIDGNNTYPVLVVIHGGAFMFGTCDRSGHDFIMKKQNTIVVKMNYRLGPLGFLSTGDDVISGNFGLKDQLLAMEWTKANVAAFNGDPESITVLGYSSGATSVHLHMMNKSFEKIAKRGVSFSGTALYGCSVLRNPAKRTTALAKHLHCPTDTSVAIKTCLKEKNATDIVRAVQKLQNIGYNPVVVFGPVIESKTVSNAFLTDHPEDIIKSGNSAQIPWLASYTKNDGGYNAAELMQKDANGKEWIEILNDRWNELAPVNLFLENFVDESEMESYLIDLRQKYLGNKNFSAVTYPLVQDMYTDLLFANGVKKSWKLHAEFTKSPVYGYVFDSPAPFGLGNKLSKRFDISFGTVHGDDVFLMFNNPDILPLSRTQSEQSEKFIKMLVDFCANGTLQFGDCKFRENTVMEIKPESCETMSFENL